MTLEGTTDRAAFEIFATQVLVPTLFPGQLVIWDNLSTHKSAATEHLLAEQGYRSLCLSPYSPDFVSIEQAFSKL